MFYYGYARHEVPQGRLAVTRRCGVRLSGGQLVDRIGFTSTADRGYQITVPLVFDGVLTAAVLD